MGAVEGVITGDLDVGSGHGERDANVVALALMVALVRALDHDLATLDAVVGGRQLRRPAANKALDRGARLEIAKGDR